MRERGEGRSRLLRQEGLRRSAQRRAMERLRGEGRQPVVGRDQRARSPLQGLEPGGAARRPHRFAAKGHLRRRQPRRRPGRGSGQRRREEGSLRVRGMLGGVRGHLQRRARRADGSLPRRLSSLLAREPRSHRGGRGGDGGLPGAGGDLTPQLSRQRRIRRFFLASFCSLCDLAISPLLQTPPAIRLGIMAASFARTPWNRIPTPRRRSSATGGASTPSSSRIPCWSTFCSFCSPDSPADARPGRRGHRDLLRPHRLHRLPDGPRQQGHRRLLPRQARHALVRHRPLGDGDPGERHHAHRNDGTGLRGWNAVHPALLRPSAGDGHPLRHPGPVLLSRSGLHRLRAPRKALRPKNPQPDELPVLAGTRALGRGGDLRSLGHPFDRLRYRREGPDRPHRRRSHALYRSRRDAGGDVGRSVADDDHLPRDPLLPGGGDRGPSRRDFSRRGGQDRGSGGSHEYRRLHSRSLGDLHVLERRTGGHLPHALLLRLRPEPGAAVSHRELAHREPSVSPFQRDAQDPDAVRDPADRGASLRLLSVREAAADLQPGGARRGFGSRTIATSSPSLEREYDRVFEARRESASGLARALSTEAEPEARQPVPRRRRPFFRSAADE